MVHSSLSSFGKVVGGADTLIDALLEVVGIGGTVIVPTFGSSGAFDPKSTETALGIVPRKLWRRKNAYRSRHPLASVAAIGAKAKWFVENHEKAKLAHGVGTPYTKLAELDGKILLLGVDQDRSTFLHTAEELVRMPYLKPRRGSYVDSSGKTRNETWPYFPGPHRNFIGLQSWLESSGLISKTTIGFCVAQLMPAKPLLAALLERLEKEPGLFISKNPNLPEGIWQNADILRAQLKKESFILAADSQYAGQYIEQAIDNLKRFGIDNLILSFVNDVSWDKIEPRCRRWYLRGLQMSKIKVRALKLPVCVSDDAIALLKEAKTKNLILPSTSHTEAVKAVVTAGFRVHIENVSISSTDIIQLMERFAKAGAEVQVAFNPLNFVRVGEEPFSRTYAKTKIKRYTGLVYINDGMASGRRCPLEEGLAEIKELISIFRCRSFNGLFVLQAQTSDRFAQAAAKFFDILKELGKCPEK
jgi:aminoglycoside 3-N-acetyltransferase